jgi:threonine synthase
VLKREDLQPSGSHKDRAACVQLAIAAARGMRGVVISSSGNAAIATSRYAELHGMPAFVCVHPATDPAKLAAIDGDTTTVLVTERAINSAKLVARELGLPNLRPSVSDDALLGYATLGDELVEPPGEHDHWSASRGGGVPSAIVLFATSGATAIAVADRVAEAWQDAVPVVFVQGEGNAAMADPQSRVTDASAHGAAAGRLGVRRSRRARQLRESIAATGGRGAVATLAEVEAARERAAATGLDLHDESAANLAEALRLADELPGVSPARPIVCVLSGAPASSRPGRARRVEVADEFAAVDAVRSLLGD